MRILRFDGSPINPDYPPHLQSKIARFNWRYDYSIRRYNEHLPLYDVLGLLDKLYVEKPQRLLRQIWLLIDRYEKGDV